MTNLFQTGPREVRGPCSDAIATAAQCRGLPSARVGLPSARVGLPSARVLAAYTEGDWPPEDGALLQTAPLTVCICVVMRLESVRYESVGGVVWYAGWMRMEEL